MARRELQEINAGSMADIAFLLLIFFLVSTTMETDKGLTRILPPLEETLKQEQEINKKNLLSVNINFRNEIKISGIPGNIEIGQLRGIAKRFILGKKVRKDLEGTDGATMIKKDFPRCGIKDLKIADQHVIQLKNDRGTSYEKYLQVTNELTAAYREIRDSFVVANNLADSFEELEDAAQRKEILEEIFPTKISETDPVIKGKQQ